MDSEQGRPVIQCVHWRRKRSCLCFQIKHNLLVGVVISKAEDIGPVGPEGPGILCGAFESPGDEGHRRGFSREITFYDSLKHLTTSLYGRNSDAR